MTLELRSPSTLITLAAFALLATSACNGAQAAKGQAIPAKVASGSSGAKLVLIPLKIDGRGPYTFAVDTGAAKSTVDSKLAARRALPSRGRTKVAGVTSSALAVKVRITSWKAGTVKLPADTALAVDMPASEHGLSGLIGSDELSQFKVVTINYSAQTVTLR